MNPYPVTIRPRILAGLRRHAAATLPDECCGALLGVAERSRMDVRAMIPLTSQDASPQRFLIEAPVVLRLERHAAAAGVRLLGFYHSHPREPAAPSSLDLELACPGYIHVIVAAATGATRAWRLRDDRRGFIELPLQLPAIAV